MEGEVQKVPVRLLLPHTVNIPLLRSGEGAFVVTDEPALTRHHHLSVVYIRAHSWCFTPHGFGQMCNNKGPSLGCHTE